MLNNGESFMINSREFSDKLALLDGANDSSNDDDETLEKLSTDMYIVHNFEKIPKQLATKLLCALVGCQCFDH